MIKKTQKIILAAALLTLMNGGFLLAEGKASLSLTPASGNYTVGQTVTMTVSVNPHGVTYDTVGATISFPAGILQVQQVSLNQAFSVASPDNTFDNSTGTISYGAGVPGGSSQATSFATITFKVKSSGPATVTLSPSSLVLYNGENIYSGTGSSARLSVAAPTPAPTPSTQTSSPTATTKAPSVTTKPATTKKVETAISAKGENPSVSTAAISQSAIPVIESLAKKSASQSIYTQVFKLFLLLIALSGVLAVILWQFGKYLVGSYK